MLLSTLLCAACAEHPNRTGGPTIIIDPSQKYFEPGPVLATPDDVERARRLDYHQQVIEAYEFSYRIGETLASRLPLDQLTGLAMPTDTGSRKATVRSVPYVVLPEKWDVRDQGVGLPPARSQGSCGSCWAFGSTAVVEAAIALFDKQLVNLSEQFILDCNKQGFSCGGGYWAYSLYVNPGSVEEAAYPYKAYRTSCKSGLSYGHTIESYHTVARSASPSLPAARCLASRAASTTRPSATTTRPTTSSRWSAGTTP
jgi:hypothetical protein